MLHIREGQEQAALIHNYRNQNSAGIQLYCFIMASGHLAWRCALGVGYTVGFKALVQKKNVKHSIIFQSIMLKL